MPGEGIGPLQRTERVLRWQGTIERALSTVSSGLIMLMMVLTTADVFLRYVLNRPIANVFEVEEFLLVGVIYLGQAYIQAERGHITMDVLMARLRGRAKVGLTLFGDVVGLIIFGIILWRSSIFAWRSFAIGETTMGLAEYPLWPAKTMLPIGFALLCLRLVFDIVGGIQQLKTKNL